MQHINRLLIQARKCVHTAIYSGLCFVDNNRDTGKWSVVPRLWDGIPGSGYMDDATPDDWPREYDSADEAQQAVNALFRSLGLHERDTLVFTMDYGNLEI